MDILQQFSMPMHINWVDGVILIVFLFYAIEGYAVGFIGGVFDFFKFVFSFVIGIMLYGLIAQVLLQIFPLSEGVAHVSGFFIGVFISEILLFFLFSNILKHMHYHLLQENIWLILTNKILGIIPGILSAFMLMMFFLAVVTALPVSLFLKQSITSSQGGKVLISQAQGFENQISGIFGKAATEMLTFLTVEPKSDAIVQLHFTTTHISVDLSSERQMFVLVNKEREKRGIAPLSFTRGTLQEVARTHGRDMLKRGYFSHYTLEGLSPFDRMNKADITFSYAGENLAFSPTVDLAMQGLMNSKGHRENILNSNFQHVSIGVLNAGIYGEMFVQEFTD